MEILESELSSTFIRKDSGKYACVLTFREKIVDFVVRRVY